MKTIEKINQILNERVLVLDGAMGTMLQAQGLGIGEFPERFNLTHPQIVEQIHFDYLSAGADIVYANTFGANVIKMPNDDYRSMILAGLNCARRAVDKFGSGMVALDIGALGELMSPMGNLTFDRAYEVYRDITLIAKNHADLVVIETISDLYELKAGVLAVKENSDLPVMVTMSFDITGRTFSGCPIESMVAVMEGLGVDAVGLNCSLSPSQIKPLVQRLAKICSIPFILKPNAGLPVIEGGVTIFNEDAESFGTLMSEYVDMGASIVGGCCGTTSDYISNLASKIKGKSVKIAAKQVTSVASGIKYQEINKPLIVGERINPTGKKLMREAILADDFGYIEMQAIEQNEAGAHILDINMGVPNIDEVAMMIKAVQHVQAIVDLPLQIDSSNPDVIEAGLRYASGKVIVNSVNGDSEVLDKVLPIASKYGALVVGLTIDKSGVPKTLKDRIAIAERIVAACDKYGISRHNIIIDCLTLTAGAEQEQAMLTLKAIEYVKKNLGVKTILGVSNISFGLPERAIINRTFLTMALASGLDLAIINPNLAPMNESYLAYMLLSNNDKNGEDYINGVSGKVFSESPLLNSDRTLGECIIKSLEVDAIDIAKKYLLKYTGIEIIDMHIIPALNIVGDGYEKGTIFLPQLISSSEVAKKVCDIIKANMPENSVEAKCKIMLATVEGDVHDIGKNIVKTVLQNYGYEIIDLGRNVSVENVVKSVIKHNPKILGLSALMTTTVVNMKRTIISVKKINKDIIICVGGAVLTEQVAKEIGADYYTKDPRELTSLLTRIIK